ncbi:hypothetical protein AVEN_118449-1 [Araneus ventricosus]|uniref:Uncharacterized protein n=1 Tax=Araneus ventricosus TaxID=182803 RepID=A0A4Y2UFR4_ARAVE|nr:hypothetical protein AVEN_118449-1 [Araneus ventricosus]
MGYGGLVVKSPIRRRKVLDSKSDAVEDALCMGHDAYRIIGSGQEPLRWCDAEVGEAVPAYASSSCATIFFPCQCHVGLLYRVVSDTITNNFSPRQNSILPFDPVNPIDSEFGQSVFNSTHPRKPLHSVAFGHIARGSGRLTESKDRCEVNQVSLREQGIHFLKRYTHSIDRESLGFRARGYTVALMLMYHMLKPPTILPFQSTKHQMSQSWSCGRWVIGTWYQVYRVIGMFTRREINRVCMGRRRETV